ncbi:MAG: cation efflux protein [Acidimicrobiales bacterium]|nr:cation efflux protein [Acidimicrobiales bacterium]
MSAAAAGVREAQVRRALGLAVFTVVWNLIEGGVAITAAALSGSPALIGFGLDSFVESLSAAVLIWRLRVEQRQPERVEAVERRAVRLIGVTFLALAAFVAFESLRSLITGDKPESSAIGITITVLSLIAMPLLARRKKRLGAAMGDRSVQADGAQTAACAYLSIVVLVGLVLNAALGWWWADSLAALGVVVFLVQEGRAAFEAEHVDDCC